MCNINAEVMAQIKSLRKQIRGDIGKRAGQSVMDDERKEEIQMDLTVESWMYVMLALCLVYWNFATVWK